MGIAERREREKERRKQDIIDAAEKVFFDKGFTAASVESVANEAELSKATLYLYFRTKDELYYAVCSRAQDLIFKLIDKEIAKYSKTIDILKAFLNSFLIFQKKYPDYFQALYYFQTHKMDIDYNGEEVQKHKEQDQLYLAKWIALVEKGKKEGIIRKELNPINSVLLIWMQMSGFLKIYSVMEEELNNHYNITKKSLLEDYFDLIFNGVLSKIPKR